MIRQFKWQSQEIGKKNFQVFLINRKINKIGFICENFRHVSI